MRVGRFHLSKAVLIVLIILCIALVVASIALYSYKSPSHPSYKVATAHLGDLSTSIYARGSLVATDVVSVGSEISGEIDAVFVEVNDTVRQGQVLATINSETIQNQIAIATARLSQARSSYEGLRLSVEVKRSEYEKNSELYRLSNHAMPSLMTLEKLKSAYEVALSDLERARQSVNEAKLRLKIEEINLGKSIITSPIDGIILEKLIEKGQVIVASVQTPKLFSVARDLYNMTLKVNILQSDIGRVHEGSEIVFYTDSYVGRKFSGRLYRVNYAASSDNEVTTYEGISYIDNKGLLLMPGMDIKANIITAKLKGVILAPIEAMYIRAPKGLEYKEDNAIDESSIDMVARRYEGIFSKDESIVLKKPISSNDADTTRALKSSDILDARLADARNLDALIASKTQPKIDSKHKMHTKIVRLKSRGKDELKLRLAYIYISLGDNEVQKRRVVASLEDSQNIAILAGLKEGEKVITSFKVGGK